MPQVQASMTFHLSSDGKEFQEDKNIFKGKKGKDRKWDNWKYEYEEHRDHNEYEGSGAKYKGCRVGKIKHGAVMKTPPREQAFKNQRKEIYI